MIAKIGTSGADLNVWTGIGDLSFEAETYSGVGNFGGVSAVQETSQLQATGVTFSLSGVPSSLISTALGSMRYGRPANLWFGLIDTTTGLLVDAPYKIFSGLTDVPDIDEGPETSVVSITAENRLIDLERPRVRRYTHEDQQIDHPGDLGFEYVTSLQEAEILWIT
jgi:hypothetical protein